MLKYVIFFILTVTLSACQNNNSMANQFSGIIKDVADSTQVVIYSTSKEGSIKPTDTVYTKNEKISFSLPQVNDQKLNLLKIDGVKGTLVFINENQDVKANIYRDSIRSSKVSSGKNNAILQDYLASIGNTGEKMKALQGEYRLARMKKQREKAKEIRKEQDAINDKYVEQKKKIINENGESLPALMILSDMFKQQKITSSEGKKLYEKLSPNIQDNPIGKKLNERLEKTSKTDVGEVAPVFSAPNPDGEVVSLKDAMGKITLIDFWASWCKPCRIENPNVVKLYNEYHGKGFNIIGVSLDKSKAKWKKAIKDDQLEWYHISHLQAWQEPIAQKYNVKSIPRTFLIDEKGKIIAKNLRGKALRDKVEALLGDS